MAAKVFVKRLVQSVYLGDVVWHPDGEFKVEQVLISRWGYEFISDVHIARRLEAEPGKHVTVQLLMDTAEDWWKWTSTDVVTDSQVWGAKTETGEWVKSHDGEHAIFLTHQAAAGYCEAIRSSWGVVSSPAPYTRPRAIEFQSDFAE